MDNLDQIVDQIRQSFDARNAVRDRLLSEARALTRHCALAIRAVHRDDAPAMDENLDEAVRLAASLRSAREKHADLYYAGYTQDALKEFVEANVTCALIRGQALIGPDELGVEYNTYLNGMAEVIGELRRRCLDILRHGYSAEAERLITSMDDIYAVLVTMDYPDAITNGLRRQTDIARNIIEKTRGDITFSLREEHLERAIRQLSTQLGAAQPDGIKLSRFEDEE